MSFTDNFSALISNYSDYIQIISACIFSAILFGIFIVYIAMYPEKRVALLKGMFFFIFIVGTIVFCICNYWGIKLGTYKGWVNNGDNPVLSVLYIVLRSVIDVGTMFYGRANTEVFYSLPVAKNQIIVFLFWLMYVTIFYTAASALLIRFGKDLLRSIRIVASRWFNFDVDIVYGINQDSIMFGRNIAKNDKHILIYIDNMTGEDYEASIRELGGIIYSDSEALKASSSFLQEINMKPHNKKLRLYAMSYDYDKNIQYAIRMLESLEKADILPEQTELMLLGTDELKGMMFQADGEQYGYGNVISFDEYEMSARILIYEYPLCRFINFDENGRATENMEVLIVGMGQMGHEVLRKLIANGQFEGSKFHATIYDPRYEQRTGFIKSQYPTMFTKYNIDFEPQEGRGNQIFQFISDNAHKLKYIVICLNDREKSRDIAIRMVDRLKTLGHPMNIYTCDPKSVRCYSYDTRECRTHWIYESDILCSGELDKYAMELNHSYMERYRGGSGHVSVSEDWKNCNYFGRMSSRASVDYLIPYAHIISKVITNPDKLTHTQREILSRNEHLRWCAFHYTFGFDSMKISEFVQRVKDQQKEINEHGESSISPTKDMQKRLHVCLAEWDKLDEISNAENAITNGSRDYKNYDRDNVDMIMELIKPKEEK